MVPLRLSSASQLVSWPSAGFPLAGPESAATVRVAAPDLLAQDALLKRVLAAASDSQPLSVQPLRDPVGLALGVVARLIVAGCAAAALAMLLIGAIPTSLRPAARIAASPNAAWPEAKAPVPERAVRVEPAGGNAQPVASAPPPARAGTVLVRSPQTQAADQSALDGDEVVRLVRRGEDFLAHGDIAAARLILGRAAEAHDAEAALSLAETYDPELLRRLHVMGFKPDIGQARTWYEKAAQYGSAEASRRLAALSE